VACLRSPARRIRPPELAEQLLGPPKIAGASREPLERVVVRRGEA